MEGAELEILETFDFDKYQPSVVILEIHGEDLHSVLRSKEACILRDKNYVAVGSAVITHFFVRHDALKQVQR